MLRSPVESYSLQIKNKVPNLVANLQGMLVGLGISGSGSIKRKETWRQQFESAPGYFVPSLLIFKFMFGTQYWTIFSIFLTYRLIPL